MNAPASIAITPALVADLLAEGERMPVYVHVIDHPDTSRGDPGPSKQTVARLQSPEGAIIGISYAPVLHEEN